MVNHDDCSNYLHSPVHIQIAVMVVGRVYFRPLNKGVVLPLAIVKKGVELPHEHIKRGSYSLNV